MSTARTTPSSFVSCSTGRCLVCARLQRSDIRRPGREVVRLDLGRTGEWIQGAGNKSHHVQVHTLTRGDIPGPAVWQLVDCLTDELIARGRRRHTGFMSPSRKMNIDVFAGGIPVLGAIVLSFVLCQRSRSGEYASDSYGAWAAADGRQYQTTQMAFLNSSMVASQPSAMAENIPLATPVVNVPPVAMAPPENIPPAATAADPEAPIYAHRFSSTTVGYGDDEAPPPYCP